MSSYFIKYSRDIFDDDTLDVAFSKNHYQGDVIVKDAQLQLTKLIDSQQLKGGKLLKINGKQSYLLSYIIAHEVYHLYQTIAVFDPRLSAYIVVITNNNEYKLGSLIKFNTNEIIELLPSENNQIPSFFIDWQGDILKAQLNSFSEVEGNQIVFDTEKRLQKMIFNEQFSGGKLLLINGRSSILAGYVIANKLAHFYGAIAIFDPKIGEEGLDKYVVTISHSSEYQVGDIIDKPNDSNSDAKIVICGSVNTGKTILRSGLYEALLKLENAPNSYGISGCPDGDGSWFNETYKNYPDLAQQLKEQYKAKFTPQFAKAKAKEIQVIKTPILIFDVGGKLENNGDLTPENQMIMSQATHAIMVVKNDQEIEQWQKGCDALNLPVIAIIYSDLKAEKDTINNEKDLFQGTIHKLERGVDLSTRDFVQKLAQFIVNLVKTLN